MALVTLRVADRREYRCVTRRELKLSVMRDSGDACEGIVSDVEPEGRARQRREAGGAEHMKSGHERDDKAVERWQ